MVRHSPGVRKPWCRYTNSYSHSGLTGVQVGSPSQGVKMAGGGKKQEIGEIFLQVNDILLWLSGQLDSTTGLIGNLWHLKTCSQLVGPPCTESVDVIFQFLPNCFQEMGQKRSEGIPCPLRAPRDSYVSRSANQALSNALTVEEPEEFPHGLASVVVGLATPVQPDKWQPADYGQQIFSNWSRHHNCQAFPTLSLSLLTF